MTLYVGCTHVLKRDRRLCTPRSATLGVVAPALVLHIYTLPTVVMNNYYIMKTDHGHGGVGNFGLKIVHFSLAEICRVELMNE